MTDFADFKTAIADWANRQDWSDVLVTSFVRMAEQKLNQDLRIDRMLKTYEATLISRCAILPDDWLQADLIQVPNPIQGVSTGALPWRYKSRDEFFNLPIDQSYGFYTYRGRNIYMGGQVDAVNGQICRMTYFAEVPVFSDATPSWVYVKYPNLYLFAALMHADLHAIGEENTAAMLKAQVDDTIQRLNNDFMLARASGSRIARTHRRSFG